MTYHQPVRVRGAIYTRAILVNSPTTGSRNYFRRTAGDKAKLTCDPLSGRTYRASEPHMDNRAGGFCRADGHALNQAAASRQGRITMPAVAGASSVNENGRPQGRRPPKSDQAKRDRYSAASSAGRRRRRAAGPEPPSGDGRFDVFAFSLAMSSSRCTATLRS